MAGEGAGQHALFGLGEVLSLTPPVGVALATSGSSGPHRLDACVLTNGYLVVRYTGGLEGADHPRPGSVTRAIPWDKSESKAIVAMCLDPRREWLATVAVDGSLRYVPVAALVAPAAARRTRQLFDLRDAKAFPAPAKGLASGKATACLWWQSLVASTDYLLIGTKSATVHVVAVQENTARAVLRIKVPVLSLELVPDSIAGATFLFVHGGDKSFRTVLEEDLVTADGLPSQPVFDRRPSIVALQFAPESRIRVQCRKGLHMLGVVRAGGKEESASCIELFGASLDRSPMFVYRLPEESRDVLVTDSLTFAVTRDNRLCVVSNLLAGTSSGSKGVSSGQGAGFLLQSFQVPAGETVLSLAPFHTRCGDEDTIGACTVITSGGIYECRLQADPNKVFMDIVLSGGDPFRLGATLDLDLGALYRAAAERVYEQGDDVARSLQLDKLASSPLNAILPRLARGAHISPAMKHIQQLLANPASLNASTRKALADVLFLCFVQRMRALSTGTVGARPEAADPDPVTPGKVGVRLGSLSEADEEEEETAAGNEASSGGELLALVVAFNKFVLDNWDYHVGSATVVLLNNGMLEHFFRVAQARQIVTKAIKMPINHGTPALNLESRDLLYNRGYSDAVCDCHRGVILRCLPEDEAIQFLLARPDSLGRCIVHALPMLPRLDLGSLISLAKYFDPSRPIVKSILLGSRQRAWANSVSTAYSEMKAEETNQYPTPATEDVIEMFLFVLVAISRKRRQLGLDVDDCDEFAPWRLDPELAMRAVFEQIPLGVASPTQDPINEDGDAADTDGAPTTVAADTGIACGDCHASVLRGSELWTWGKAQGGRLGHGDIIEEEKSAPPIRVETLCMLEIKVMGVACGAEHTLVRTTHGVFAWGAGDHGQLGLGDRQHCTRPVAVPELQDKTAIAIACGQDHSLVLATDGVWAFGLGSSGQLGLGKSQDVLAPQRVRGLDKVQVVALCAGRTHSVFLTSRGRVYTCGGGAYGQLGHGSTARVLEPKLVQDLADQPVRLIGAGFFVTLFVTHSNKLYTCGRSFFDKRQDRPRGGGGDDGGHRRSSAGPHRGKGGGNNLHPAPVDLNISARKIVQVVGGRRHALLLTDTGNVASWGSGQHGQLGHGNDTDQLNPRAISLLREANIANIAAGDGFSCALDESGQVWVWGQGEAGQLGQDGSVTERFVPVIVPNLPAGRPLSAMSNHSDSSIRNLVGSPLSAFDTHGVMDSRARSFMDTDQTEGSRTDYDLPDFASMERPYASWTLPICLTGLNFGYRVTNLLDRCKDWGEWDAAAHIYAALGDLALSFGFRVRSLLEYSERKCEGMGPDFAAAVASGLGPLIGIYAGALGGGCESQAPPLPRVEQQLRAIAACALEAAASAELSGEQLEALLLPHLSLVFRALTDIVLDASRHTSKGSARPLVLQLSTPFYLQLARLYDQHGTAPAAESAEGGPAVQPRAVSQERLLSSILANLEADLHVRDRIVVEHFRTQAPVRSAARGPARSRQDTSSSTIINAKFDTIVFSCGHMFDRRRFVDEMIPKCRADMDAMKPDVAVTASLVLQDYLQSRVSLACPLCLVPEMQRRLATFR